jgi:two-component system, cell cycle response regulator
VSPGVPSSAGAERGPVGTTPTVQRRLALQRPRPLLVRLYAALFSDLGLVGPPARRRALRFIARSLPAAVAVGVGALVAIRVFGALALRPPQLVAMAILAATLVGVLWRRAARASAGDALGYREQLEIGTLALVAAFVLAQAAAANPGESPFQPAIYLVIAFLVAFLAPGVGAALVALAVALEAILWSLDGARVWELPEAVIHAGFVTVFAMLYHAVLAAQIVSGRRDEQAAVDRRVRALEAAARQFRIRGGEGADDPAARERRWTEAAVIEIEAAVGGALDVAEVALRSHTCALYWLSDDERSLVLRDCRSPSEAIARGPVPAGEGPLGGAVKRRAPIRLHGGVKAATHYLDGTQPRALLAVPLVERRRGHVRGVIVADRMEDRPFGDEDERLLQTLASEILRAVDAERLMRDVRATREQAEHFYRAIERLNRKSKLLEVLDELIGVARDMVPADFAAVVLRDEGQPERLRVVRVVAEAGKDAPRLEDHVFGVEEGLIGSAIRMDVILPATELDLAKTPIFGSVGLRGLASLKILPLKVGEATCGALVVGARRQGAYGREVVQQLDVVAMHAAQSIDRARLFEKTERLATTDGLTGLVNHRTFQERLDAHLAQAHRYGKRTSLLLCDIDHFKSVNDTYGHPVGDLVLKAVARTLGKEARNTDVVARYGGEEFAVVMPETDTAGAMVIAERIRERVGALVVESGHGPLKVTMSLGIATFPDDGAKKPELIERADGCLYHAKRHGRNQSVSAASLRAPNRAAG